MKRILMATVILLIGFQLVADEQSAWPILSESEWTAMTPESLSAFVETHNVNARDEGGRTALMGAAESTENPDVIRALIEAGADVNARTEDGKTALMFAGKYTENPDVIQALINAGADVNARDEEGWTALIVAGRYNQNPDVIRVLVEAGADVNARNESGWTALMLAGRNNENPEVVWELLKAGADPTLRRTRSGKTAWDLIQDNEALRGTDVYWELNDRRFE